MNKSVELDKRLPFRLNWVFDGDLRGNPRQVATLGWVGFFGVYQFSYFSYFEVIKPVIGWILRSSGRPWSKDNSGNLRIKGVHRRNSYFLRYKKSNYKNVDLLHFLFTALWIWYNWDGQLIAAHGRRIMLETLGLHIAVKSVVILAEFRTWGICFHF